MARLSINDLNNLSGVSENDMDNLFKEFRNAHTHLFKKINDWINVYETYIVDLKRKEAKSMGNDILVYRISRNLYYEASTILNDVDLFDEFTAEYQGLLDKLHLDVKISDVRALQATLRLRKKDIIQRMSVCYGLYSEAYYRLEEDYEG